MKECALIPAFNEEKNIKEVISHLKKLNLISIVVDDGSKDRTYEFSKKAGAVVLRHETNKGKGEAIKTGFDYILKNHPEIKYVVLIDADLQYDPAETTKLLTPLKNGEADFIMGYRTQKKIPYANRIGNFGWRVLFNFFFKTKFKDTNCGYMAFTKKAIIKTKIHGGYIIENSILIGTVKNGLRTTQVPVDVVYGKRKVPKFAKMFFGVLFFIVKEGLKYRLTQI